MSRYITLRHTNREYRVIANHLSASGLRLAPHLTHASPGQLDNHGAGDIQWLLFDILLIAVQASDLGALLLEHLD